MKTMKFLLLGCVLSFAVVAQSFSGEDQKITRAGDHTTIKGSSEIFTGDVRVELLFSPIDSISAGAGMVTFEPGARSHWHTHPAGQQIFVISGVGRTGTWDGKVEEIHAGDVVTCPKGIKHWHGASPTAAMTHLTVTGELDGKNVDWLEAVSNEQYNK